MPTYIEEIARWVESVSFKDLPSRVLDRARYQMLNIIAAAHAGAISPSARKVMEAVRKWDSGGLFPVVTGGKKFSLHGSLFVNTALSMAHDYDDYLFLGHTGHSAVFTGLLVGMAEKRSMQDVITAQVIGNEIGGRLGAACLIGPQNGQMWTFIHVAEAAAVAAKLMGLDARGIAHAIAIGFYQPPFAMSPGFMGPDTKLLSAAQGSLAGLMAAQLAREGFTGPLDILENPRGFLAQFSYAPMGFMLSGWGKSWVTESIAYKIVPGCAYIDTTVDAMMIILDEFRRKNGREMTSEDVREVTVLANLLTIGMNHMSEENVGRGVLNPIAINFSIPANIAILILTGDLKVEYLDPDWLELHREDILALCRRIKLEHDWEMSIGVNKAMGKVLDLSRVVDSIGMTNLLRARRRAAAHFGTGVTLGIKDFLEMRSQAGLEGKDYLSQIASGALKRVFGSKKSATRSGPPDLGESDFSKFTMPFAAKVTIRTSNWKEYSARQDIPCGGPGQPWEDTVKKVENKFRREAGRNLSAKQVQWTIDNIAKIEDGISPDRLMEHLIASGEPKPHPTGETPSESEKKQVKARKPEIEKEPLREPKSIELDLPPVIIEPLKPRAKKSSPPAPEPKRPVEVPLPKPTQDKLRAPNVTLRPAGRRDKPPRPSKGAKRKRLNRP